MTPTENTPQVRGEMEEEFDARQIALLFYCFASVARKASIESSMASSHLV